MSSRPSGYPASHPIGHLPAATRQRGKVYLPLLFLLPVLMFGFGYLMVPIYDVFCDLTGLNGKTKSISTTAAAQLHTVQERQIKVQFIATVNHAAEWEFGPNTASMLVHPGQTYQTSFYAQNLRDRHAVGQGVPSVSPGKAASYFSKTECFCFHRQEFAPQERRELPVTFVLDPNIPADIESVTLSYTLFDLPQASQASQSPQSVN